MSDAAEDRDRLAQWWEYCRDHAGLLPAGVDSVQERLIRAVGRGTLPRSGAVFVKVMGFPRLKDRIRYVHRALPAHHEARMLGAVAAAGIPCPRVVAARGRRRRGLPHASMLVTAALDRDVGEPEPAALAGLTAALADAGVFHPDLNPGNFALLRDGSTAVLDLQSARLRRPGLDPRMRLRMAAKLCAEVPAATAALTEHGFLTAAEAARVRAMAAADRRDATRRRILRCLRESTEFAVERRWNGRLFRRRSAPVGGARIDGGPELVRYWIGDRAREVLDGRPPMLRSLFRKSWWLPGRHSVYLLASHSDAMLPREASALLEGFERFEGMAVATTSAEADE